MDVSLLWTFYTQFIRPSLYKYVIYVTMHIHPLIYTLFMPPCPLLCRDMRLI